MFQPLIVNSNNIKKINNADYRDIGGLHDSTTFSIRDTMVTSASDTLLANSTSNAAMSLLRGSSSFVGIDPSVSPLQLLFFLKVSKDQFRSN